MKRNILHLAFMMLCLGILPATAQVNKKPSKPAATPSPQLNLFNPNKWVGTWERRSWLQDGAFEVQSVSGNVLSFNFSNYSGSLNWDVKGRAYLQDNHTAVFSSPIYRGCKITFHLLSDSVITIDGNHCETYGKGVLYTGKFINNKYLPEPTTQTMFSLHLLNKQQDATLQKLVGENAYSSFVILSQRITEYKPQKRDGSGMKIFSAIRDGVKGYAEYIIMVDNANHIWTAMAERGVDILYFTNTNDKKKLPQPIEQWRSHLSKKYPVIYK